MYTWFFSMQKHPTNLLNKLGLSSTISKSKLNQVKSTQKSIVKKGSIAWLQRDQTEVLKFS